MKRFLVFSGLYYYPDGGWYDLKSSHEMIEGARRWLRSYSPEENVSGAWAQIVDMKTGTLVESYWLSGHEERRPTWKLDEDKQ